MACPRAWTRTADARKGAFSRIEVLGLREATVHLTDHVVRRGVPAAFPAGVSMSIRGRGKKASPDTPSPSLLIPVTIVPASVHKASEIA